MERNIFCERFLFDFLKDIDKFDLINTKSKNYLVDETNDKYEFIFPLAGYNKNNLSILYENKKLTIKTNFQKNETGEYINKNDYPWIVDFNKSFYLEKDIIKDNIKSTLIDGILTITLPIKEEDKGFNINID